MRKFTNLCVLCQSATISRSRPFVPNSRKLTTISRKQPLELSSLAIDLDAYDSPAVRKTPNSDFDYPDLPMPWPSKLPLSRRTQSLLKIPGRTTVKSTHRKDSDQITPPDLLQWALADDIPQTINYRGKSLLRRGMRTDDTIKTKAEQLAFEYSLYTSEWDPSFVLSRTQRYRTLRRILFIQAGTKEGCTWLGSNGRLVKKAIKACARHAVEVAKVGGEISRIEPLSILNDLLWGMRSKEVDLPEPLCEVALLLACQTRVSQAINNYLQILIGFERGIDPQAICHSMDAFCHSMLVGQNDGRSYESVDMWNLTGSVDGGEPIAHILERNTPSFATLVDQHLHELSSLTGDWHFVRSYCNYILWLGRLRLTQTLHSYWNDGNIRLPSTFNNAVGPTYLFATAFLLAKDAQSALSVMKTGSSGTISADVIKDKDSTGLTLRTILQLSYSQIGVDPHHVWDSLKTDQLPKGLGSPEVFLNFLSRLLMTDAPPIFQRPAFGSEGIYSTSEDLPCAHLTEFNGERGLLVPPARGSTPLYFKAEKELF